MLIRLVCRVIDFTVVFYESLPFFLDDFGTVVVPRKFAGTKSYLPIFCIQYNRQINTDPLCFTLWITTEKGKFVRIADVMENKRCNVKTFLLVCVFIRCFGMLFRCRCRS